MYPEDFDKIIKKLKSKRNKIIELDLCRANYSPEYFITLNELDTLLSVFEKNTSLRKLYLNCNNLDARAAELIANFLKQDHHLTDLTLGGNPIGEAGAGFIAESLMVNKTLRFLGLANTKLTASGAKVLFNALLTNKSLIRLDIQSNDLGNETIKVLATMLANNQTSLRNLNLNFTNIDDQGLEYVSNALLTNTKLAKLTLYTGWQPYHWNNSISDKGIDTLLKALEKNIYITEIDMNYLSNMTNKHEKKFANLLERNKLLNKLSTLAILLQQGTRQPESTLYQVPTDILIYLSQLMVSNDLLSQNNIVRNVYLNVKDKVERKIPYQLGKPMFDLWKKPKEIVIDQEGSCSYVAKRARCG